MICDIIEYVPFISPFAVPVTFWVAKSISIKLLMFVFSHKNLPYKHNP